MNKFRIFSPFDVATELMKELPKILLLVNRSIFDFIGLIEFQ